LIILIFLRHARTPNNAQARLQGQFDSPLDEVGLEQARVTGEAIADRWGIDRVVTTSRRRTIQTAAAAGLGDRPSVVDDRWQEIDFGDYDDRPISDVIADLGAAWANDVEYIPPNGESMGSMHRRVGAAVEELIEPAADENIVVVTHATPVKSAVTWLLAGEVETILRLRVNLASVTAFAPAPSGLLMSDYNWCPARGVTAPRETAALDQPDSL
jgi:probable phosphoglycerate mutase